MSRRAEGGWGGRASLRSLLQILYQSWPSPLQWQACPASVLVDTCGAGGVRGGLETNPGSAWLCWVVLRLGPLEVLQGVALTVLAQYLIPPSLAGSVVRMCVSTCVLVSSL